MKMISIHISFTIKESADKRFRVDTEQAERNVCKMFKRKDSYIRFSCGFQNGHNMEKTI